MFLSRDEPSTGRKRVERMRELRRELGRMDRTGLPEVSVGAKADAWGGAFSPENVNSSQHR